MTTYVISDIHGCYDEFLCMLARISLNSEDKLILAGDYIDRGRQSLEMLRWLEKKPNNVLPIKGNHDAEFIENIRIMREIDTEEELMTDPESSEDAKALYESVKYMLKQKSGAAAKYYDYYGTIKMLIDQNGVCFQELCRWADMMKVYPFFYRFPMNGRDCIVVHAGFCEAEEAVKDEYSDIVEFYLYARDDSIRIGGVKHGMIISGHTPTIAKDTAFYSEGKVFRYHDEEKDCIFYNIDCGCAYHEAYSSGTMSCIHLEDEKVLYL